MKIVEKSHIEEFKLVPRTGRGAMADCTRQLIELVSKAKRGQAVVVYQDDWQRKTFISANDITKKTNKPVAIRTLEAKEGWMVFLL